MTHRSRAWIIVLATILLLLGTVSPTLLRASFGSAHIEVVFDGEQFSPQELFIEQGTTVYFKNEGTTPFWPASSLHPSHTVLSAFDPKEPIAQGQTWWFTFDTPGSWGFHDHIRPTATGIIHVSEPGTQALPLDCSQDAENAQCWEKDILAELNTNGLTAAFAKLTEFYNNKEGFRSVCHSITHSIGAHAYELYIAGVDMELSQEVANCGYGFFHGFIETLIVRSGNLAEAREFCAHVGVDREKRTTLADDACYHGIGHGVLDGSDPRTWGDPHAMIAPALELCTKVGQDRNQRMQCGVGVFNALSDAVVAQQYDLHIEPEEAYAFCKEIEEEQYKYACYEQMNVIVAHAHNQTLLQSFAMIDLVEEEEYKPVVMRTLSGARMKEGMSVSDYEKLIADCYTTQSLLRERCLSGAVMKLIEFGPMGKEYEIGVDFCTTANMEDLEKSQCLQTVGLYIKHNFSQEEAIPICTAIGEETGVPISCEF